VGSNDVLSWIRVQWDRVGAWGALVAGAITLFIGWRGVSETAYTAKQLPYIAGCGLGGMFLIAIAATMWLSADLRDEWRKLDRIEAAIRECGTAGLEHAARQSTAATSVLTSTPDGSAQSDARSAVGAGRSS
jgi:hypothetical protein